MVASSVFVLVGLTEASLYDSHRGAHCYSGHGGVPLDADDKAIGNTTVEECETLCDTSTNCIAVTIQGSSTRRRKVPVKPFWLKGCRKGVDYDHMIDDL